MPSTFVCCRRWCVDACKRKPAEFSGSYRIVSRTPHEFIKFISNRTHLDLSLTTSSLLIVIVVHFPLEISGFSVHHHTYVWWVWGLQSSPSSLSPSSPTYAPIAYTHAPKVTVRLGAYVSAQKLNLFDIRNSYTRQCVESFKIKAISIGVPSLSLQSLRDSIYILVCRVFFFFKSLT